MRIAWICATLATGFLLSGCASPTQQAQNKEQLLGAAGFRQIPANTPQRRAELAKLPPLQLVRAEHDGHVVYLYADPVNCNCLFHGSQSDWRKLQKEKFQMKLANKRLMASEWSGPGWGWNVWGPGLWARPPGLVY